MFAHTQAHSPTLTRLTSVRQTANHSARIYTHRCRVIVVMAINNFPYATRSWNVAHMNEPKTMALSQHQIEQRPITKQNIFSFSERRPINLFWHFDGNLFSLRTQYRHHFEQQQQQQRRRRTEYANAGTTTWTSIQFNTCVDCFNHITYRFDKSINVMACNFTSNSCTTLTFVKVDSRCTAVADTHI